MAFVPPEDEVKLVPLHQDLLHRGAVLHYFGERSDRSVLIYVRWIGDDCIVLGSLDCEDVKIPLASLLGFGESIEVEVSGPNKSFEREIESAADAFFDAAEAEWDHQSYEQMKVSTIEELLRFIRQLDDKGK